MADDVILNLGTGGDTVGADDIGGIKYQRVKLIEGANGVNDGDISSANPLPVEQIGALPAGDNNIGNVDIVTMPAITATDLDIRNLVAATDLVDLGGNALTALQLIDDTIKTLGTDTYTEATTKGSVIGAIRRDADTTAVNTDNEVAPLLVNAIGALKVEVFSGETLPISGTVSVTEPVSIDDNAGSLTVDAPVGTPVNVQIGNATLSAGVIDETGAAAVDALAVGGGTAHDAVDSGNPVKIGGVAVSGSATPTSVASGDRTRFIANQHGIPYQLGGHPNLIVREFDFGASAQTDLQLSAAAVAADERCYVVGFEAMCDNANTVAVSVRAGFGASAVPTASATGVSGMIATHPGIAAGSGIILGNAAGIIAIGAAGEEPRLTSSAATTGNLHVIIRYFIIDETP